MINTKRELRDMIALRDRCTKREAAYRIACTQQVIDDCVDACTLDDIEDILATHLGIELDYIHLFLF